ncbi:predicted protein [Naegleria gruberi]|uniref:Predicted protein n=1 Tax=Naegleria gruberi TaxID=5762 RepID=D2V5M7_NAEGR|nr:uncharacterized protein NAEGRDRAFT_64135 [Naegleria gruberi]EFC47826.1 predicted protein [Naegleria gruberi]|eukprot:XP_002680570.1 predicted protein [Naegleria gruberi strain NEG-M]
MNNIERACRVLQEIIQTDQTTISKFKETSEMFNFWLTNNLDCFTLDQQIYLRFQYKKLDQIYWVMKEYYDRLNVVVDSSNYEACFELCVGNLSKFLDNDLFMETFIVNSITFDCNVWKGIYNKIFTNEMMINFYFLSRLSRYILLYRDLQKYLEDTDQKEKTDLLLKKLTEKIVFFSEQSTFLKDVKKNTEFLQSIELYMFDYLLVGLEFEIINSKEIGNQLIENGSIAISKLGELLLFKPNSNEIIYQHFLKVNINSDAELGNYERELEKVVDIRDMKRIRLFYGKDEIQINSKEYQIIFRFKKKENQISMWNALTMKRKAMPTYFEFKKAGNYHDIDFSFE